MHEVACNNDTDVVEELIKAKADVNAKDNVSTTPWLFLPDIAG